MKTNVKKELIICLVALIVLGITITQTYASQTITNANEISNLLSGNTNRLTNENATNILDGQNRNNTVNNTVLNTNTNRNTNNNINNNMNSNRNNNVNKSNNNELPATGLDTPSLAIVAICLISAIYAYKKVRDYNNI